MNVNGLERRIDECLVKQADPILGRRKTLAGSVAQTGLYFVPVVGSALSLADGVNDMFHGRWKSGLGNLALGVGSGIADLFSFGTAGTAMRGAVAAGKLGVRGAALAAKAGKLTGAAKAMNAAKGAGFFGRNIAALRAGRAAMAGKGIDLARRGAQFALGANGYSKALNTAKGAAEWSRGVTGSMKGWKDWKAIQSARDLAKQSPMLSKAYAYGKGGMEAWKNVNPWVRVPVGLGAGIAAYNYIPGMDYYANLRYGGSGITKLMGADGVAMIPRGMKDRMDYNSNPYRQQARQQADSYGGVLWNHGDNFGRGTGQQYQTPDFSQYGQPNFQQFNNWNQR